MDESEQRLAHGGRIEQHRSAPDSAGPPEPLHAFMHGWRRQTHALPKLGVTDGRVLDQHA